MHHFDHRQQQAYIRMASLRLGIAVVIVATVLLLHALHPQPGGGIDLDGRAGQSAATQGDGDLQPLDAPSDLPLHQRPTRWAQVGV